MSRRPYATLAAAPTSKYVAMAPLPSLDKISDRATAPSPLTMTPFAPSAALAPHVRTFNIVEATRETVRSLLPDNTVTVAFRYSGSASLLGPGGAVPVPDRAVSGLRTKARRMRTSAGGGVVVAILNPGAAGRFFTRSPFELFESTEALEAWAPPDAARRTSKAMRRACSAAERIALFEDFLLGIARPWQPDPIVVRAMTAIAETAGAIRMSELARAVGSSQDALEKRFRRIVGATPKRYASVVRFRHAIAAVGPGRSLTEVSLAAGYADQSHFNRAFRHVTGEAPREFIGVGEYCSSPSRLPL